MSNYFSRTFSTFLFSSGILPDSIPTCYRWERSQDSRLLLNIYLKRRIKNSILKDLANNQKELLL